MPKSIAASLPTFVDGFHGVMLSLLLVKIPVSDVPIYKSLDCPTPRKPTVEPALRNTAMSPSEVRRFAMME